MWRHLARTTKHARSTTPDWCHFRSGCNALARAKHLKGAKAATSYEDEKFIFEKFSVWR